MEALALILNNWEVITLIVTNIGALFMKPPVKRTKRTRAEDLK